MVSDPDPSARGVAVPVRYDYLDALRGWAFLGVLSVHAAARAGGTFQGASVAYAGKYGVQLFFMVSAFTIFLTLDRAGWNGWWNCPEFFIRRFFRILPMFWIGLALYAFLPGRAADYNGLAFTPLDYVLTGILQHGWQPKLINSLVPGGWSIAVEGIFYLLAPFCFRAIRGWQAALGLLLGSLAVSEAARWAVANLYLRGHLFAGDARHLVGEFLYCWFPAQLPVFACGILTYHVVRSLERHSWNRETGAVLLAASALWVFSCVGIGAHGWIGEHVFFALGFVPLILGLKAWPARFLVNPATRFLGKISYSAYLLHFVVLETASNSLDTFLEPAWQSSLTAFASLFVVTLAGTVPLAWLASRWVERPCIELGAKWIRRRRTTANEASPAARPSVKMERTLAG